MWVGRNSTIASDSIRAAVLQSWGCARSSLGLLLAGARLIQRYTYIRHTTTLLFPQCMTHHLIWVIAG